MKWDNLPESWKVFTLARVLSDLKSGFAYGKHYATKEGIPQLRPYNIDTDGRLDLSQFKFVPNNFTRLKEHLLVDGDILFNNTNSPKLVGKSTVFREHAPYVYSNHMTRLRVNPSKASPDYVQKFLHLLWTQRIFEEQCQQWVNQAAINAARLLRTLIPLPPPEEQRQIAEILELADELRRKRKAANQLTDKIIHSLFLDMFGDPATNPKGWGRQELQDICEFETNQMVPEPDKEYFYIGLEDIESNSGQPLKSSITTGTHLLSSKHSFDEHHVLYGKLRPYLNKVALPDREGICSTDIVPLRPKDSALIREYLAYYLMHPSFVKWATDSSTGTKMPRLQTTLLKRHMLPIPALPLQQRFAELVSQFEEKRKQTEQAAEELERLYQSLLKKAFTGELTRQWREVNQVKWEPPQLTERQKVLLAVLYSYNTIQKASPPITMLMKYMFLLQQEKGLDLEYAFVPYKFGPFSKEVYEDIEALEKEMLVIRPTKSRSIERQETALDEDASDDIETVLATIPENKKEAVGDLVEKYGSIGFNELINYVYSKYPEFAVETRRVVKQGGGSQKTSKVDN